MDHYIILNWAENSGHTKSHGMPPRPLWVCLQEQWPVDCTQFCMPLLPLSLNTSFLLQAACCQKKCQQKHLCLRLFFKGLVWSLALLQKFFRDVCNIQFGWKSLRLESRYIVSFSNAASTLWRTKSSMASKSADKRDTSAMDFEDSLHGHGDRLRTDLQGQRVAPILANGNQNSHSRAHLSSLPETVDQVWELKNR